MTADHLDELRGMIADVLEIEASQLSDTDDFATDYEADSLSAIEILARIEKEYKIEIPQQDLAEMRNLKAVHAVVGRYAGWPQ